MKACIQNAFDHGWLTLEEKQKYERRWEALVKAVPRSEKAKEALLREMKIDADEKERRALITEAKRKNFVAAVSSYRNRLGQQDLAEGFRKYIEELEYEQMATLSRWLTDMDGFAERFKKGIITGDRRRDGNWVGNADVKMDMLKVVRELRGEKTKDPMAAAYADAIRNAIETARQEFNAAGGNIAKLENYDFPQFHNPEALFNKTKPEWVKYMMQEGVLDRKRMKSYATDQPLTDAELKEALENMWDTVTSNGFIDMDPKMTATGQGRGATYKQNMDHRFIHFASAEAAMKYAKDFGNPSPYESIINYLERMARDVTAMNKLGPNPAAMMGYGRQFIQKHVMQARTLDANRAIQMSDLDRITKQRHALLKEQQIKVGDDIEQTIAALHKELSTVLNELDGLRAKRGISKRPLGDADTERMAELHREIVRIEGELTDVRRDPFNGLTQPLNVQTTDALVKLDEEYRNLLDEIRLEPSGVTTWMRSAARRKINSAEAVWNVYTGTTNTVHDYRLANAATVLRNYNVFTKLGSAAVTAIGDLNTQKLARAYVGMDRAGIHDVVVGASKMLSADGRAQAMRSMILVDSAMNTLNQSARFAGAINSTMWSGYMADRVLAASGLNAMTQAQKMAYGFDFFGWLGDNVGKSYKELPPEIQRMMRRNRFTPEHWEAARKAELHLLHPEAAGILRPNEIADIAGVDVANRYLAMMYAERRFAIIEPTLRARAITTVGLQKGTWPGEVARSAMQFKSFGITMLMLHGGRMLDEIVAGRWKNVAQYGVGLLITGTVIGAVVVQLKDIIYGRDPRPMDNLAFWMQATAQSGGWGIYGDFLSSAGNRFGGGLTGTLMGPSVGEIEKVLNMTVGNAKKALYGEKTHVGSDVARFVQGATPGASLWYLRKISEAMLFDNVARTLDPDADAAIRRRIQTREKDYYGQRMWWEPGQSGPARGPDFSRMIGAR